MALLSRRMALVVLTFAVVGEFISVFAQEPPSNFSQHIPRDMTNAERLTNGLPLKKPQLYRRHGQKRGNPSAVYAAAAKTSSAEASAATGTQCSTVSGTIKVTSSDGSLSGYVGSPNEEGLYGYCEEASKAVKFTYSSCDVNPREITGEAVTSENIAYDLFGTVQDSRTGCYMVGNVPHTDAQSPPVSLRNPLADSRGISSCEVASTIWNVTGESLTAHVVKNTSSTPLLAPVVYSTSTGVFALNGDGSCNGTNATLSFVAS